MKKLLAILSLLFLFASCDYEAPEDFVGCVVVGKDKVGNPFSNIHLKLTPELKETYRRPYRWVRFPEYEWFKYEVGDTIK